MNKRSVTIYGILAMVVILADRITKTWALGLDSEKVINQFLSFGLTFNRGINWGIFNSTNPSVFIFINILIALVIVAMMIYTVGCWVHKQPIIGNILIIAGAVSNYFDRMVHGGVIDFIVFSWGTWSWPAFNIADAAICLGVGLIILDFFLNKK